MSTSTAASPSSGGAGFTAPQPANAGGTAMRILFAVSTGHLLNDTIQSLLPAIYPVIKDELHLSFAQIGLITLAFQLTASILQPLVGIFTDKYPQPFSLAAGTVFTLVGVGTLAVAHTFGLVLVAAALIGFGSSIFHPEASRVARMASGGRHGFAQSVFQVGGNVGSALGPLLASLVIAHRAQATVAWFAVLPLASFFVMQRVGAWYRDHLAARSRTGARKAAVASPVSRNRVILAIAILAVLIFSKHFYLACMTSYYTFYLINTFQVSVQSAQFYLFHFLAAVAMGTVIGGPIGDRIGRKYVIWVSILGAAPFAAALPYANLFWCDKLAMIVGVLIASAFPAIIVYAQELIPHRVGMISGLFFGFAFGMGGIGSAALGELADQTSVSHVFKICAFLPLLGLLTVFLPNIGQRQKKA